MTIELSGLDGRNPIAYLAALGTLSVASRMMPDREPRLGWNSGPIPRPFLSGVDDLDEVVDLLDADRERWSQAAVLNFDGLDDVKLDAADQRRYLLACRNADDDDRSVSLVAALIAEGATSRTGAGKPTDLHFNAGQQRFLVIARALQSHVDRFDLVECVQGPWTYSREEPTFGWDVSDDRVYALGFSNPSKETKMTVPGADWLALMGLSGLPATRVPGRAAPPGSSGSWKYGSFSWPLWHVPLDWRATQALIAHGCAQGVRGDGARLGVFRIMQSAIRRSEQGGYGSFSPSSVEWSES